MDVINDNIVKVIATGLVLGVVYLVRNKFMAVRPQTEVMLCMYACMHVYRYVYIYSIYNI